MTISGDIIFDPAPGTRLIRFRGDCITFRLTLPADRGGRAFLRTNIGHAEIARAEVIRQVRNQAPPLGRDWFDIPMTAEGPGRFRLTLPLCQEGHFEAKGYVAPDDDPDPVWPPGPNVAVNVAPAETCCANIIYNPFVRQFGPNKAGRFFDGLKTEWIDPLDRAGYTVIPPSGTFRNLIAELDFIVDTLGCRILQLLPIHPTPTTYARMGRFGSPYAALTFTAVDPALAEFDPKATPLEQFLELVDGVHARQALLFIDIAINHTGWAASLHESHPEWLVRDESGAIEVPGAWGVRWEDLTRLDFTRRDLWQFMADVFLTWCRRGVDGFRCDAGYMIPLPAWQYITATVREQFPETVFFLEGLGGRISVTRDLLNRGGFNWAYSELFQNEDRAQVEHYLSEAVDISDHDGITVHFAETHDNPRLAARSRAYARMRTALCALCAHQGAFGFANGVEWYATEKINVHESPSLNWGAADNQIAEIARLTALLKRHPAFFDQTRLHLIPQADNCLLMVRHHAPSGKKLLVAVNLDAQTPHPVAWSSRDAGFGEVSLCDLLTGSDIPIERDGDRRRLHLAPAQACCLSGDPADREPAGGDIPAGPAPFDRITRQRLQAKALEVFCHYAPGPDLADIDLAAIAGKLHDDPVAFCRHLNPASAESRTIDWHWPEDTGREVMVPPGHFLLVRADTPFRARIEKKGRALAAEKSLPAKDGRFFALFRPLPAPRRHKPLTLKLSVFAGGRARRQSAPLLYLSPPEALRIRRTLSRRDLLADERSFLKANRNGSVVNCPLAWGELDSRYDALLSANAHPDFPVNRRVMLTRCRLWGVYQDYSRQIDRDCIAGFSRDTAGRGIWQFHLPTGRGRQVALTLCLDLSGDTDRIRMEIRRLPDGNRNGYLADDRPVQIILRPDIENRSFHETTKAYLGPEHQWPAAVTALANGFDFRPDADCGLRVRMPGAEFVREPEWQYMVHRAKDAARGLDPDSDLFSPGYFSVSLKGDQQTRLSAEIVFPASAAPPPAGRAARPACRLNFQDRFYADPIGVLRHSLNQFLVQRRPYQTVIAGYPWFLDWGRDSLIFARGLVAAGRTRAAGDIIRLFARYEQNGTLPNMIVGTNAENRDTSDAPLWLGVVCRDLLAADQTAALLDAPCGPRTLRRVLISIGEAMRDGTPNGIRMDPDSGLIFSPAHFTWMDTSHPTGTPREGYPVEIQALWFAMLDLLAEIDDGRKTDWRQIAGRVRQSLLSLFYLPEAGYLCDCLHAPAGTPAGRADADDALRPNQLLALTLGALSDRSIARRVVTACEALLVPGAIRSLADRPLKRPLEISYRGKRLGDPNRPYRGRYTGDEDTRRKPAYHNGTAWTWLFPVFCEAWVAAYGEAAAPAALSRLSSSTRLIDAGCAGHIPEITDGDFPHRQRGCDAQAWGISEWLRVWLTLTESGASKETGA